MISRAVARYTKHILTRLVDVRTDAAIILITAATALGPRAQIRAHGQSVTWSRRSNFHTRTFGVAIVAVRLTVLTTHCGQGWGFQRCEKGGAVRSTLWHEAESCSQCTAAVRVETWMQAHHRCQSLRWLNVPSKIANSMPPRHIACSIGAWSIMLHMAAGHQEPRTWLKVLRAHAASTSIICT